MYVGRFPVVSFADLVVFAILLPAVVTTLALRRRSRSNALRAAWSAVTVVLVVASPIAVWTVVDIANPTGSFSHVWIHPGWVERRLPAMLVLSVLAIERFAVRDAQRTILRQLTLYAAAIAIVAINVVDSSANLPAFHRIGFPFPYVLTQWGTDGYVGPPWHPNALGGDVVVAIGVLISVARLPSRPSA